MINDLSEQVTCVIVDDHPAVVDAIKGLLKANHVNVVGTAANGEAGFGLIKELKPTVAVIDLKLTDLDGFELIRRIAGASPRTSSIVYTGSNEPGVLYEALEAGARGFVVKDSPLSDLIRALGLVARGGMFIDPVLGGALTIMRERGELEMLTARQLQIIRLLSEGLHDGDIAERLCISVETVRAHVKRSMARLRANTRSQAVAEAMRRAYIT